MRQVTAPASRTPSQRHGHQSATADLGAGPATTGTGPGPGNPAAASGGTAHQPPRCARGDAAARPCRGDATGRRRHAAGRSRQPPPATRTRRRQPRRPLPVRSRRDRDSWDANRSFRTGGVSDLPRAAGCLPQRCRGEPGLERPAAPAAGAARRIAPDRLEAKTSAGTFYRLQAGPLPTRDGAVQACSQVKAGGTDCFIVGPLP